MASLEVIALVRLGIHTWVVELLLGGGWMKHVMRVVWRHWWCRRRDDVVYVPGTWHCCLVMGGCSTWCGQSGWFGVTTGDSASTT